MTAAGLRAAGGWPAALRAYLRNPAVQAQLRELQTPSAGQFLARVLGNWLLITACIALAQISDSALLLPLVWLVIAARQHALLILMHDATHYLASRSRRLNDGLGELLCAAPLLISMATYRGNHLAHHAHLNTDADPDWRRKIHNDAERASWLFPNPTHPLRLLAGLYARSVGYLLRTVKDMGAAAPPGAAGTAMPNAGITWARRGLWAAALLGFSATGTWAQFLLYWLIPNLLVLPWLLRLRSIAEHFALDHDHPLRESRNVIAPALERFLLAPHHIGLHLAHHVVANVPVWRLPALHELMLGCAEYRDNAHCNDGYLLGRNSLLWDMAHRRSARLPAAVLGA